MTHPATSPIAAWAQLVRLPTVFTVIADVGAAYLLVAGGADPWWPLLRVLGSGIALYWAGMVFNDVFDVERDRRERPARPLAAGQISLAAAALAGSALMFVGVLLAAAAGRLPGTVAVALAIMILAYDGPLKGLPIAPLAMGSCRFLSFLLGASAALAVSGTTTIPVVILAIAAGFGTYITGVTTMARDEAGGGHRPVLTAGLLGIVLGLGIVAAAPAAWGLEGVSATRAETSFAWLIALMGLPVIIRGWRAVRQPTPGNVQQTIRVGVLSIIPLAAAVAFLGAGPRWGLGVFSLLFAARALGSRLRIT